MRVTNAKGEEVKVSTPFYTGAPIDVRWKLKPGDVAKLHVLAPAVNAIKQPGQYTVRYTIRFNSRQSKDDQGNVTFPLPGDWQSELETGDTPLYVPPRIPGDDNRAEADEEKAARAGQH